MNLKLIVWIIIYISTIVAGGIAILEKIESPYEKLYPGEVGVYLIILIFGGWLTYALAINL